MMSDDDLTDNVFIQITSYLKKEEFTIDDEEEEAIREIIEKNELWLLPDKVNEFFGDDYANVRKHFTLADYKFFLREVVYSKSMLIYLNNHLNEWIVDDVARKNILEKAFTEAKEEVQKEQKKEEEKEKEKENDRMRADYARVEQIMADRPSEIKSNIVTDPNFSHRLFCKCNERPQFKKKESALTFRR